MLEIEQKETVYAMVGGDLSLDFTNTVSGNRETDGLEKDKLTSYAELVSWSRQAGIFTSEEARHLLTEAGRRPSEAAAALASAIELREAIYKLFSTVSHGRQPSAAALRAFNSGLSRAMARSRINFVDGAYHWGWEPDERALDRMIWPVARAAADLLTSGDLERVRGCSGDDCGWIFVDRSKNRSRHWCDMRDCGNRAKVKRFYRRKRDAGEQ
jgi:predicted RNA-binding Zn ribbon-like protein